MICFRSSSAVSSSSSSSIARYWSAPLSYGGLRRVPLPCSRSQTWIGGAFYWSPSRGHSGCQRMLVSRSRLICRHTAWWWWWWWWWYRRATPPLSSRRAPPPFSRCRTWIVSSSWISFLLLVVVFCVVVIRCPRVRHRLMRRRWWLVRYAHHPPPSSRLRRWRRWTIRRRPIPWRCPSYPRSMERSRRNMSPLALLVSPLWCNEGSLSKSYWGYDMKCWVRKGLKLNIWENIQHPAPKRKLGMKSKTSSWMGLLLLT